MSEQPENLSDVLARDQMFSHDEKGRPVTRQRTCECGKTFTQRLLSARFLAIVEKRGRRPLDLMTREVPDYFVPVHCPSCERTDLAMMARRSSYTYLDRPEPAS